MKTINLKVVIPKWAKYTAIDSDGSLYAYKLKPFKTKTCWYPQDSYAECEEMIGKGSTNINWFKTLKKIT